MSRVTRKDCETAFGILARMLGREIGQDAGQWYLDYAPPYGGYVICEHGGRRYPLTRNRLPARQFLAAVNMAIEAVELSGGAQ